MDIERIMVRMLADATQYNRVMSASEQRLIDYTRTMNFAGSTLSIPIIAAVGALGALGAAMMSASNTAIQLAVSYERSAIALEVMTGSAEKGKKLLEDLTALAIRTPFKSPELIAGASSLKAFGSQNEDIIPTLEALGDVSSATGTELRRLILAYGQVQVAGRLMGPELRQFIDAGVPLIKYLADVMDKPVSSIKTLVEEGRVGFPEVVKAFDKMTSAGGLFAGMNDRISKTVSGRWSAFVETLQNSLRKGGEAFLKGFGVNQILEDFTALAGSADQVTGEMENFFREMRSGIDTFVLFLKAVFLFVEKNREMVITVLKVVGVLVALKIALFAASLAFSVVVSLLAVAKLAFVALAVGGVAILVATILTATGAIDFLVKSLEGWVYFMSQKSGVDWLPDFKNTADYFRGFIDRMAKLFQGLKETFMTTWEGITDAIKAGDLELAGKIAFKGLEVGFKMLVASMKSEWRQFTHSMVTDMIGQGGMDDVKHGAQLMLLDAKLGWQYMLGLKPKEQLQAEGAEGRDKILKENLGAIQARNAALADDLKKFQEPVDAASKELKELALQAKNAANAVANKIPKMTEEQLNVLREQAKAIAVLRVKPGAGGIFGGMGIGAGMAMKPEDFKPLVDAVAGNRLRIPFAVSGGARELADKVTKDMEQHGDSPLAGFEKNMGLLKEAFQGPPLAMAGAGAFGGAMFATEGAGGIIKQNIYDRGIFQQFEALQKSVHKRDSDLPPLAMRDSREAQDTINRSLNQTTSVQEDIRNTILESKRIQEAARDYQKEVSDTLKRMEQNGGLVPKGF